jgi:NADPH2:quinone reductase
MNAIIITKPGPPEVLKLESRPVPVPKDHEVLIEVKAAGINRPDIAQRKGKYPAPPGAPADIPGLEVAGIVESCGEKVTRWKHGDIVCALLTGGGYAEFAIADERICLPVPSHWDLTQAACLPETIFTVWHNVFQRGQLKKGEHLLIHGGSSGIGVTAIQLAKAIGAKVTVTARSAEKCTACINLGADKCINYKTEDFQSILADEKVDVILDMVGGDYIEKNISILKPDGRLIFINTMKGSRSEFDASDIMKRRLTITGSTLRNRDIEFKASVAKEVEKYVWPIIESGKFKPVVYKQFPLLKADEAQAMMERSEHVGKIVLVID